MDSNNILPIHGEAFYTSSIFESKESDIFLQELISKTPWQHQAIKIFGKEIMQPRLTAWYADPNVQYGYSGIRLNNFNWTPTLLVIKNKIEIITGEKFNSVLINFYRNHEDSMGWHRDNEKELGKNPKIASVSFGASRTFKFRLYQNKKIKKDLILDHGSLLMMSGETQHYWEHALPKQRKLIGPRINLTFRLIHSL